MQRRYDEHLKQDGYEDYFGDMGKLSEMPGHGAGILLPHVSQIKVTNCEEVISVKKRLSYLILIAVLALNLAGCGEEIILSPESEEQLQDGNTLSVYISEADATLNAAIQEYKIQHPEVELVIEMPEESEYNERLSTELMSGKGPDIICAKWTTFPDVYKAIDNGVFLDMSHLVENCEEINQEDFVEAVISTGRYKGGYYFVPTDYMVPLLISEEGNLRALGVEELIDTPVDKYFWKTLVKAYLTMKEHPGFETVLSGFIPRHLLAFSGVVLYDREMKKVLPDEEAIWNLTEIYKGIVCECGNTKENSKDFENEVLLYGLQNHQLAFVAENNATSIDYILCTGAWAKAAGKAVVKPMNGVDGKLHATVLNFVGINGNSKNTKNAWDFMKILVSKQVQDQNINLSVRKDSLRIQIERWLDRMNAGADLIPVEWEKEEIEEYLELVQNPDSCYLYENDLWDFYLEAMEPYFTGKSDYESCLTVLRDRITIYVSE